MADQPQRRWRLLSLLIGIIGLGFAITAIILSPNLIDTSHAQSVLTPVVTSLPPTATPPATAQP
jgi:hypothetical protein